MSKIKVYPAEIEAGLGEAIANNNSLSYKVQLESIPDDKIEKAVWSESVAEALAANLGERPERDTYDLYPVKTILVSTGWNLNDDIFSPAEVWEARHSPEDKPFNLEHQPRHIIGHIVGNVGVDTDLTPIPDNTDVSDLPDKFHVVTSAVIYRHLNKRDPSLTEEAAEIIAGIKDGDWCVSMECLFAGFDYGLRDPSTGRLEKVIARQESTAFLTKHLRVYRGTGQYNGYSVGRVLRNINFIGKGLVENPANPESEFIFNDIAAFAGKLQTPEETNLFLTASIEEETATMADETRIRDLETQLSEARKQIDDLMKSQAQAQLDALNSEIATRDETIEGLNTQVTELTEARIAAETATDEVNEALATKTSELEAVQTQLGEIQTEATKVARVSTLVDRGMDKEKAEETVAQLIDLDDDKFAAVAALVEVQAETESSEAPAEETSAEENAEAGQETEETEEAEANTDEEELENAEEETQPNMAAASDETAEQEEAQANLSSFCGTLLRKGRNKS